MVGLGADAAARAERCQILVAADRRTLDLAPAGGNRSAGCATARPDVVLLAAARVGGIAANNAFPVDFLADNLAIELNVIRGAIRVGVASCCFSDRPASIRGLRRSRCARRRC